MSNLAKTLIRDMKENEVNICADLEQNGRIYYTIELQEEPGEICITRLMKMEDIEKSANEAVSEVFPGRKASKVTIQDVYLRFEIN